MIRLSSNAQVILENNKKNKERKEDKRERKINQQI